MAIFNSYVSLPEGRLPPVFMLMLRCRPIPHHFRSFPPIRQEGISTAGTPDLVPRGLSKAGLRRKAEVCQAGQIGCVKTNSFSCV